MAKSASVVFGDSETTRSAPCSWFAREGRPHPNQNTEAAPAARPKKRLRPAIIRCRSSRSPFDSGERCWENAASFAAREKLVHRAARVLGVAERIIVGVHREITIEHRALEAHVVARLGPEQLVDELVAMGQAVANAFAQQARHVGDGLRSEPATYGITTQRKRQAKGKLFPCAADVDDAREALAFVGESPFVDQERGIDRAA